MGSVPPAGPYGRAPPPMGGGPYMGAGYPPMGPPPARMAPRYDYDYGYGGYGAAPYGYGGYGGGYPQMGYAPLPPPPAVAPPPRLGRYDHYLEEDLDYSPRYRTRYADVDDEPTPSKSYFSTTSTSNPLNEST